MPALAQTSCVAAPSMGSGWSQPSLVFASPASTSITGAVVRVWARGVVQVEVLSVAQVHSPDRNAHRQESGDLFIPLRAALDRSCGYSGQSCSAVFLHRRALPTPALPGQVQRSTALAALSAHWCELPWLLIDSSTLTGESDLYWRSGGAPAAAGVRATCRSHQTTLGLDHRRLRPSGCSTPIDPSFAGIGPRCT